MTSAIILIDRVMKELKLLFETGDVSNVQHIINQLDAAGEIIVSKMEKHGCLQCISGGFKK